MIALSMSVEERREGASAVLILRGALDMATVPLLHEQASAALANPAVDKLDLDLAELQFLDSTGIGCFVELRRLAHDSGKHLGLRSVPPNLARLFAFTGMAEHFGVAPKNTKSSAP